MNIVSTNFQNPTLTKGELKSLSDSQLISNISLIKKRRNYYYSAELRRLEKIKSKAIIKDLNQFRSIQDEYNQLKSLTPLQWLKSWETYLLFSKEAIKRKLDVENN